MTTPAEIVSAIRAAADEVIVLAAEHGWALYEDQGSRLSASRYLKFEGRSEGWSKRLRGHYQRVAGGTLPATSNTVTRIEVRVSDHGGQYGTGTCNSSVHVRADGTADFTRVRAAFAALANPDSLRSATA